MQDEIRQYYIIDNFSKWCRTQYKQDNGISNIRYLACIPKHNEAITYENFTTDKEKALVLDFYTGRRIIKLLNRLKLDLATNKTTMTDFTLYRKQ